VARSTRVWVLILLGGADSSIGSVCTALLIKTGASDVAVVVG
jgi:ABC-type branched-subunit amino acid transport system permease subunit